MNSLSVTKAKRQQAITNADDAANLDVYHHHHLVCQERFFGFRLFWSRIPPWSELGVYTIWRFTSRNSSIETYSRGSVVLFLDKGFLDFLIRAFSKVLKFVIGSSQETMQWQGPAFPKEPQTRCDFRILLMKPEQILLDSLMEIICSMRVVWLIT